MFLIRTVATLLSIWIATSAVSYAGDMTCAEIFSNKTYRDYYELAYAEFLRDRNLHNHDLKTITFKKKTYHVVDLLGLGLEGYVLRAADDQGRVSIFKHFPPNQRTSFLRQIWDYYRMNSGVQHPYTVVEIDFKNRIFRFDDIRGIPMNEISKYFKAAGAPWSVEERIWQMVAMVGYHHYDQNTLFDIDRQVFVAIDPH